MISITPTMTLLKRFALVLFAVSLSTPITAQTHKPITTQKPVAKPAAPAAVPTFDTLLAADSYKIYGEIRGVGQLIRSNGINDLLDPMMKLTKPPKEFKTLVRWLNLHADELVASRLLVAAWPSRPNLPQFVCAIEFPSAEEAQKFEPQLRKFLPEIVPAPTPAPTPSPSQNPTAKKANEPATPPYVIKHAGSLVLITERTVSFKTLRPTGSKLLVEDQNFRQSRDRFASEPAFVYFDMKTVMRQEEEQRLKMQQQYEEEQKKREADASSQTQSQEHEVASNATVLLGPVEAPPAPSPEVQLGEGPANTPSTEPPVPPPGQVALDAIMSSFFGGMEFKWPDGIALALTFDNDSYNLKLLLLNEPLAKGSAIPFIPQLVSGPQITPSAPSVFPADTDMLISGSLDFALIYEGILKNYSNRVEMIAKISRVDSSVPGAEATTEESPFVAYEKFLGIKLKEDLLPMLGNEIAIGVPLKAMFARAAPTPAPDPLNESSLKKPEAKVEPALVIAISVKDKEGVKALIPKIIESMGIKGASLLAQTERRGDTELVSYANIAGYAFIGDFLIVSADVNATRHVVDSYLNNQTLGADSRFRNFTRWQPRQVLGQVYVSEGLLETFGDMPGSMTGGVSDKLREVMMRLNPVNDPVTYALYNEGLGPLHEVHLPKNVLVMLTAGIAVASDEMPQEMNEVRAQSILRMIVSAEETYKVTKGDGSYGTLEQLIAENLISKEVVAAHGYKIELTASNTRFEATAIPTEYGKTGKVSFFVDQSGVLRSGDHGGGPATIADKPLQ